MRQDRSVTWLVVVVLSRALRCSRSCLRVCSSSISIFFLCSWSSSCSLRATAARMVSSSGVVAGRCRKLGLTWMLLLEGDGRAWMGHAGSMMFTFTSSWYSLVEGNTSCHVSRSLNIWERVLSSTYITHSALMYATQFYTLHSTDDSEPFGKQADYF